MNGIAENLAQIRTQIGKTTLIAVSKTRSSDDIIEAIKAQQWVFGENRVQEAREKFVALRDVYPDIVLHLIGALQTNKAQDAVEIFDVIQTVDRPQLADAIAKAIQKTNRTPRLYIQVNIGDEPQKAGIALRETENFLDYCRNKCGLDISGLMCIPPHDQDPRPFFKTMRGLTDKLGLPHLSMGMSGDYQTAIECGATEVRIGTGIFRARS